MRILHHVLIGSLLVAPAGATEIYTGEVNLGLRATHYASDKKSAKYDEYLNEDDGFLGWGWMFYETDSYSFGMDFTPFSDLKISGNRFGLVSGRLFYQDYTHNLSRDALSPAIGIGSDYLIIPDLADPASIPPLSAWQEFDYEVDITNFGGEVKIETESPFYSRFSYQQQRKDGTRPYGTTKYTGFELPMPIDYTTNILSGEGGYRDKETALALVLSYSDFDNGTDLLSIDNTTDIQEYSTAPDNYSYTVNSQLRQQLPYNSQLAATLSYTRNLSDTDFGDYAVLASPTTGTDYDGDVTYWQGSATVMTRYGSDLESRFYLSFLDRDDDSDVIELEDGKENDPYSYDKQQVGIDLDYRVNSLNRLGGGYMFTRMHRERDYVDDTNDNLLFVEWRNTSLDWLESKLRLEYLNRDADSDFDEAALEVNNDLIYQYFKPYDIASKDSYSAQLTLEMYPAERLELGLRYGLTYNDFDDEPGLQSDQRHEIYLDASYVWPSKTRLSVYFGYEYIKSELDGSWTSLASSPPSIAGSYSWREEYTYDFFVVGGTVTVPLRADLELELNADYQHGDGKIDYSPEIVAGGQMETLDNPDDYYRTELGAKAIYHLSKAVSLTAGYAYEKARLDEWLYDNYSYIDDSTYLSGAGLDNSYEAHQFYLVWTYRF